MTHVAIIGAGVIGCSVALELARKDVAVTVIDRHGAAGHGSTSASCGIVRHFYSTPTMTAMAFEGSRTWRDWGAYLQAGGAGGLARFEQPGMLFLPPAMDADVERIVAHMRALGVPVEILSVDQIAERFPFLDTGSHWPVRRPEDEDFFAPARRPLAGGIFEPEAGYVVSPMIATDNLRVAGEQAGASFRLGRRVTAISEGGEPGQRFRLELEDGSTVLADVVLNAGGPHSGIVNALAGVTLPIQTRPLRREVHAVGNPQDCEGQPLDVPVVGDVDGGVYFRPEAGGHDLVTGSLEPECDALEWVDDPDDWRDQCTTEAYERQVMRLMKRFPDVKMGPRRGVAGLYDVTVQDWNPILDKTDLPGFYVAMGTSGSSFKTAPVIGRVMAELIVACEGGHDHDAEPLRVQLPRTGHEVNLGFFSRRRGALASSGTVLG